VPDRKPAEKFEDLIVWQKAHRVVLRVYFILSRDLGYLQRSDGSEDVEEVGRMLRADISTVRG